MPINVGDAFDSYKHFHETFKEEINEQKTIYKILHSQTITNYATKCLEAAKTIPSEMR